MNFTIPAPVTSSFFPVIERTLNNSALSDVTKWDHQLFDGLTEPQRLWLSNKVTLKTYSRKSIVFQPNDLSNRLYLVLSGKVKIEILNGHKNWLVRDLIAPGELFGINGLFGQTTHREYARTLRTKVEVIIFKNADLRRIMEVNFGFAEKLMRLAAQKAVALEQRSIAITFQSANERLLRFLLGRLEKEGERKGPDWFYDSQITQEELGAYIGTGRQTVTEILTELQSKNVLTYNWGKFWVHDREGLEKMVRGN